MTPLVIRLKEIRIAKGLTQKELADKAKMRQASVSRLESGAIQRIELEQVDRLAKALGVSPLDLLGEEGPGKRSKR